MVDSLNVLPGWSEDMVVDITASYDAGWQKRVLVDHIIV